MREKLIEKINTKLMALPYGEITLNTAEEIADSLIEDGYVTDTNVGKWISVKDRLPPYNHDVLVYRPNMASKILVDCYVGYYGEDDGEWYEDWARYGKDIHNKPLITHWAEMPQPPKGE